MDIEGLGIDPFRASPGELLASVADAAPGPMTMSVLLMVDRSRLSAEHALLFLQVHERVSAWWQSLQAEALVAVAAPEPRIDEFLVLDPRPDHDEERTVRIADAVREEIAAALRLSPATAQQRIDTARLLAGPLAATAESLELGEITAAHVAVIVQEIERLSSRLDRDPRATARFAAHCRAVQKRVLPIAGRSTVARTRRAAAAWVERIDRAGQAERRRRARVTRGVHLGRECDGITPVIAHLETTAARAIMAAVDAAVTSPDIPGDCAATLGERRAEVLTSLVLGAHPGAAVGPSLHVELEVCLPADALTESGRDLLPTGLSDLLADPAVRCSMRPVVTDPHDGHVLDIGRRRYTLPTTLRRLIVGRDLTCRFPGCHRPAVRCQIDHARSWDDGGRTDAANLGPLCVRHHQLKTWGGWRIVESRLDGSCRWISPLGHIYEREPEPVGTVRADPVVALEADAATDLDPPPF